MGRKGFPRGAYLQWTTMGPELAAVSGLSSTSATRRSRGPADSGVWWSGQAEKRMCFRARHCSWCWVGPGREKGTRDGVTPRGRPASSCSGSLLRHPRESAETRAQALALPPTSTGLVDVSLSLKFFASNTGL